MTEDELRERFGNGAVDALFVRLRTGTAPEVDPQLFGGTLSDAKIGVGGIAFLDAAAEAGLVERIETWRCPESACRRFIDTDAVSNRQCPHCRTDYRESGLYPTEAIAYRSLAGVSRSVPWLIAIHGINTRGPWQEEFSWQIANRFKYQAPVLIYKYGFVRVGVLFRWRHRMLARQLGQRIRNAVIRAQRSQIEEPPDVVIHSFGSQLFRLVLDMPDFHDLRFGRVVAVGSVIRPDFEWSSYIMDGRIEAVLDQCGSRDWAVPFAQFIIPGTGPGGRHGFLDPTVINVRNDRYGHSSAFTEAELARNLARGGLWDRFLREPLATFSDPTRFEPSAWSPALELLRWLTRVVVILLLGGAALVPALLLMFCVLERL
jgi:hypothetical protein